MNKILLILSTVIILIVLHYYYNQKVKIIYFYDRTCVISNITEGLINNTRSDFGKRVEIIEIDAFKPKQNEAKLVEKFNVKGVPLIIIDGRVYPYEYNYTLFKIEVCKRFVFKPKEC